MGAYKYFSIRCAAILVLLFVVGCSDAETKVTRHPPVDINVPIVLNGIVLSESIGKPLEKLAHELGSKVQKDNEVEISFVRSTLKSDDGLLRHCQEKDIEFSSQYKVDKPNPVDKPDPLAHQVTVDLTTDRSHAYKVVEAVLLALKYPGDTKAIIGKAMREIEVVETQSELPFKNGKLNGYVSVGYWAKDEPDKLYVQIGLTELGAFYP
jgi:hypothetical protein